MDEKPVSELGDEEVLVLAIKKPSLFKIIIDRYEPAFRRRARRVLGTRDEVDDAVVETFTKIYFHAGRFQHQEGATFRSWAYKILLNTSLSYYRRLTRERGRRTVLGDEAWAQMADPRVGIEVQAGWRDSVVSVLSRLPADLARTLRLYFFDDRSHRHIAAIEGISVGAAKTRLHRAKKQFKKIYESNYAPDLPDLAPAKIN
ncbi:MAG: RNA polymerase sigma factor [Patescibacteria group bacterium]